MILEKYCTVTLPIPVIRKATLRPSALHPYTYLYRNHLSCAQFSPLPSLCAPFYKMHWHVQNLKIFTRNIPRFQYPHLPKPLHRNLSPYRTRTCTLEHYIPLALPHGAHIRIHTLTHNPTSVNINLVLSS